ncbi:MAG TPA: hypothetical protein VIZ86_16620 [Pseudomonas sp.]
MGQSLGIGGINGMQAPLQGLALLLLLEECGGVLLGYLLALGGGSGALSLQHGAQAPALYGDSQRQPKTKAAGADDHHCAGSHAQYRLLRA